MHHVPYIVGPVGHAYWLDCQELWACPVLNDGRLDFENRLAVREFEGLPAADIQVLTKAMTELLQTAERLNARVSPFRTA